MRERREREWCLSNAYGCCRIRLSDPVVHYSSTILLPHDRFPDITSCPNGFDACGTRVATPVRVSRLVRCSLGLGVVHVFRDIKTAEFDIICPSPRYPFGDCASHFSRYAGDTNAMRVQSAEAVAMEGL